MTAWRRILAMSFVMGIAGCDSGSEEDIVSYEPDPLPGEFYDARVTRNFYPDADWATGQAGAACSQEYSYFESRSGRVRVYGSTAYSETTFKLLATEIEDRIDPVLDYYGWRWGEFVYDRPASTPYPWHIVACLNNALSYSAFASGSLSGVAVAPYHAQWPADAGSRLSSALHEFVKVNLAGYSSYAQAPAWFKEGQNGSVSEMDAVDAVRHYEQNPVLDQDPDIGHSVLAYEYLEAANGEAAMTLLLLGMQDAPFEDVFDSLDLKDADGRPLTYQRFTDDYHDLIQETY